MGGVPEPVLDQAQEQEFDGKGVFPCFSNGEMQHSGFAISAQGDASWRGSPDLQHITCYLPAGLLEQQLGP